MVCLSTPRHKYFLLIDLHSYTKRSTHTNFLAVRLRNNDHCGEANTDSLEKKGDLKAKTAIWTWN